MSAFDPLPLTITPYERRHLQAVLDLLFDSRRAHNHLDWHDTGQWLDAHQNWVQVGWRDARMAGLMGVAPPLNRSCWLRLIAIADDAPARELFTELWTALCHQLRQLGVCTVAVLIIEDWLMNYLPGLGFTYEQDIITLRRNGTRFPEHPRTPITIRAATLDDLEPMAAVDHTAFSPPWQMSVSELRQARKIATHYTVALEDEEVVGYQISTLYRRQGHLARLAVLPRTQGTGVGSALLEDVIQRFLRRSIHTITVNTQSNNYRSQRLYARYGFVRNGYDLPVWVASP
jgi:N-acetylglutamate synthase-like GNAT family acetyltransferase